jgi:hypothetical protein
MRTQSGFLAASQCDHFLRQNRQSFAFEQDDRTGLWAGVSDDPARDMYPGAGHEWFSIQHWISVEQDGVSATVMPLDATLGTFGDINRGEWPTEFGQRPGNIFSYVMNTYWHTNYRAAQGGHFRFRYVITSATRTDAAALSRMGWEESTPLEQDQIRSQDKALDLPRPLNGNEASLLAIDDPDLLLDTWKPTEDGNGTILRFIDLGRRAAYRYNPCATALDEQDRCHGCSRTRSEANCAGRCTHLQNPGSGIPNSHGSHHFPVNFGTLLAR